MVQLHWVGHYEYIHLAEFEKCSTYMQQDAMIMCYFVELMAHGIKYLDRETSLGTEYMLTLPPVSLVSTIQQTCNDLLFL